MNQLQMINSKSIENIVKVLNKGKLFRYDCEVASDSEVALFEKKFAQKVGVKYAIAMNSCSSALFVSLLCAGIKPKDKVAVPAFTFIAVPSAIVHAGAEPILIEIDENYVMDLKDFEQKIQSGKIKALLLSYMRGRVPNLDKVIELCKRYNVVFLEDSAHSLGVLWEGVQTGTFGLAGSYSMQSYKMLDGGEGGILVTNDKLVAFKAMLYSGCYENNWKKHFDTEDDEKTLLSMTNTLPAYNFRMSNLSAAVLISQLDEVEVRVEHFNNNYNRLVEILSQNKYIRVPKFIEGIRPVADSIQWEFRNLNNNIISNIKKELAINGIHIEVFSGSNARCFWNWRYFIHNERCEFTKTLLQNTVDMRLRLHLTEKDIDLIGNNVLDAIQLSIHGDIE